jgi:5-methylcytosine-specific restriction endonuclease McrA
MPGNRRGRLSSNRCKLCVKESLAARSPEEKLKKSEYLKNYVKNNYEAIKEKRGSYFSDYYQDNKERLRPIRDLWRQNNLDLLAAKEAKRRSGKLYATPTWLTDKQLSEIKSIYKLAKKLEKLTGIKYHVDHIVPLKGVSVCGLHVPWNLKAIPAEENLKKHNKLIEDMI